jgi:hypothetical protein
MNAEQAIAEINKVGNGPHLVRIFVNGRDCGAWIPATVAASIERDEKIRAGMDFEVAVIGQYGPEPATQVSTYKRDHYADDLRIMIKADQDHLVKAVDHGDRVLAHGFVDAIINNQRELEDLTGSPR